MATALSRRVEKAVGYPPLVEMDDRQRREFHEALLDADSFEDLPGKWQAGDPRGGREPAEAPRRERRLARELGVRSVHLCAWRGGGPLLPR
jgi:hypothetical protein